MLTLTSAEQVALSATVVPMAVLLDVDLPDAPLRLCSAGLGHTLSIDGQTYTGTGDLGNISAIAATPGDLPALSAALSGVPLSMLAAALSPVTGVAVRMWLALFQQAEDGSVTPLSRRQVWQGQADILALEEGPTSITLQLQCQPVGIGLQRPRTSLWTDAEQRRLYGNDLGLQYLLDQVDRTVVWPASQWFLDNA